jgi:acetyl-CoA synthetase
VSTGRSDTLIYDVPADRARCTHINAAKYASMHELSVSAPETFWAELGRRIDWIKPFTKVKNSCFDPGKVSIKWFEDGATNVASNCIDRHLAKRADQVAIIWEGDDPKESKCVTYRELHEHVCRFANVLKSHGVRKGDAVSVYLPMIPEAAYAMLACARIGAVHSVVFGGFSPDSLAGRIEGCKSKVLITADEGLRGGRRGPLKVDADQALKKAPGIVDTLIVVKRTGGQIDWVEGRDVWYADEVAKASREPVRRDDNPEVFKTRLDVYREQTAPVNEYCRVTGIAPCRRRFAADRRRDRTTCGSARSHAVPSKSGMRSNETLHIPGTAKHSV